MDGRGLIQDPGNQIKDETCSQDAYLPKFKYNPGAEKEKKKLTEVECFPLWCNKGWKQKLGCISNIDCKLFLLYARASGLRFDSHLQQLTELGTNRHTLLAGCCPQGLLREGAKGRGYRPEVGEISGQPKGRATLPCQVSSGERTTCLFIDVPQQERQAVSKHFSSGKGPRCYIKLKTGVQPKPQDERALNPL